MEVPETPECDQQFCYDNPLDVLSQKKTKKINFNGFSSVDQTNNKTKEECITEKPLTRSTLGKVTWSYLHTLSFSYPKKPSAKEKESMRGFLKYFSDTYPCTQCRGHFKKDLKEHPPKLNSQDEFVIWMCETHNRVIY